MGGNNKAGNKAAMDIAKTAAVAAGIVRKLILLNLESHICVYNLFSILF